MITIAVLACVMAIGGTLFGFVTFIIARDEERKKAAKAGVGRWVCDTSTGKNDFVYKVWDKKPGEPK